MHLSRNTKGIISHSIFTITTYKNRKKTGNNELNMPVISFVHLQFKYRLGITGMLSGDKIPVEK